MLRRRRITIGASAPASPTACRRACRWRRTGTARGCGRSSRSRESPCPAGCAAAPALRRSRAVTRDTVVVAATRRMKSSAARIIPTSTATVRSANTVSANVTSQTSRSVHPLLPELRNLVPLAHVVGDDQQDRRRARPSAPRAASGAANSRMASSVSACTMPATGVRAPERTLVAVRAIAPVAGRPPNERRHDVGDALREELDVGVVARARSCDRRPPPTSATRSRRASPP